MVLRKSPDYHDYVIKNGIFVGAFEEMYQNVEDPWCIGDATDLQYDIVLMLLDHFSIQPERILDIGCGKGAFTYRIKRARPDSIVLGVDISQSAIQIAQKTYSQQGLRFETMDIKKEYNSFQDRFDLVIMSQIIWYILPVVKDILRYIFTSMLNPGGHLCINQSFPKPEQQTYGKEIVSSLEDLTAMIDLSPLQIIETNRPTNHNAAILYRVDHP